MPARWLAIAAALPEQPAQHAQRDHPAQREQRKAGADQPGLRGPQTRRSGQHGSGQQQGNRPELAARQIGIAHPARKHGQQEAEHEWCEAEIDQRGGVEQGGGEGAFGQRRHETGLAGQPRQPPAGGRGKADGSGQKRQAVRSGEQWNGTGHRIPRQSAMRQHTPPAQVRVDKSQLLTGSERY